MYINPSPDFPGSRQAGLLPATRFARIKSDYPGAPPCLSQMRRISRGCKYSSPSQQRGLPHHGFCLNRTVCGVATEVHISTVLPRASPSRRTAGGKTLVLGRPHASKIWYSYTSESWTGPGFDSRAILGLSVWSENGLITHTLKNPDPFQGLPPPVLAPPCTTVCPIGVSKT